LASCSEKRGSIFQPTIRVEFPVMSALSRSCVGARRSLVLAALAAALGLVPAAGAAAKVRTLHLRYGPIGLQPAELKSAAPRVRTPQLHGSVTGIHAYVVDHRGNRLPSDQVMLHHAVFRRLIPARFDRDCASQRDSEPFYATGEEDETLSLPPGYGLRLGARERWRMRWMLMNHTNRRWRTFIRYDVRVDTSRKIVPVSPLWLRVVSCRNEYFDVPGTGGLGSVFAQSRRIVAGRSGRIVAATGHLHGGAIGLTLTEPRCGGRALVSTTPVYRSGAHMAHGGPVHDGPVHVTSFSSPVGIPIFRGQRLDLTATYDNSVRYDAVMGTMHVYVARGLPRPFSCLPLPPATVR
jgi:Stress up-regulated Nod 19